uniref:Uncharacterized protein n=1 Tax=Tanacetum cinerariifolium TaxID=118510 RepID=A0A699L0U7_TANCI|nr:hypothetical protein [Tanacetum cinerariifolium]
METKDTLSSCLNSKEQQMQQIQDKAKKVLHGIFSTSSFTPQASFKQRLKRNSNQVWIQTRILTIFGQDVETFTGILFLNMNQLEKQLDKEEFQEIGSIAAFKTDADKSRNVDTSKALDASLVDIESSGKEFEKHDTSSKSRNDIDADDADIRPIYDKEPMDEVQLTVENNVFARRQHHTD